MRLKKNINLKTPRKAFTLIELIVVIGIIGLIAAISLISLSSVREKSRNTRRVADIKQLHTALEMYYDETGHYPNNINNPIEANGNVYLKQIPTNPTPRDDGDCKNDDYIYATSSNSASGASSYYLAYCISQEIGGIDAGGNTATDQGLETKDCGIVKDVEGNIYHTVVIGTQCWMSENMRTTKYPDGSNITKGPSAHGASGWDTDQAQYSCPPNTSKNGEDCSAAGSLGMLYQWSAVMNGSTTEGAQGICPTGWHIPTDAEVYTLENYLSEGTCDASRSGWGCDPSGSKLAGNDAIDQNWPSGNLTNHADFDTSGFNEPAVGYRTTNGHYYGRASYFDFWSSSETGTSAWNRHLNYTRSDVNRYSRTKANGFSARCIKD